MGIFNTDTAQYKEFVDDDTFITSLERTQERGRLSEEVKLSFAPGMLKLSSSESSNSNKNILRYILKNKRDTVSSFVQLGDIMYVFVQSISGDVVVDEFLFIGFVQEIKFNSTGDNEMTIQNAAYHLSKMKYNVNGKDLKQTIISEGLQSNTSEELSITELVRKICNDYNKVVDDLYREITNSFGSRDVDPVANTQVILNALKVDMKQLEPANLTKNNQINTEYDIVNFRAQKATALEIFEMLRKNYFTDINFQLKTPEVYRLGAQNRASILTLSGPDDFANRFNALQTEFDNLQIGYSVYAGFLSTLAFEESPAAPGLSVNNLILKNYDLRYENTFLQNQEFIITKQKLLEELRVIDPNIDSPNANSKLGFVTTKDLKWQLAEDVQVNARFKIIGDNNEVTEFRTGDGGRTIDFVQFGNITQETLEKMAENRIQKEKYTGYRKGSNIQTYMYPLGLYDNVFVVDVMNELSNEDIENFDSVPVTVDQAGDYQIITQKFIIDKIVHKLDTENGFKTNIFLGPLIKSNVVEIDDKSRKFNNKTKSEVYDIIDIPFTNERDSVTK